MKTEERATEAYKKNLSRQVANKEQTGKKISSLKSDTENKAEGKIKNKQESYAKVAKLLLLSGA